MRQIEKQLSEEFGLTREEIKTIVNFSYAELNRQLYSDGLEYEISGLGKLYVKGDRMLKQEILKRKENKFNRKVEDTLMSLEMKLENYYSKEKNKTK